MSRPHILLIASALPPLLDGIGDHTAHLAAGLAGRCDVTVLVPEGPAYDPIAGVTIRPCWSPDRRGSVWAFASIARELRPDWIALQYNPFGYGRRGLNLSLPRAIKAALRQSPGTRFAFIAHEEYVPVINAKFAVMTTWQRYQFARLGRLADVIVSSIDVWAVRNRRRFAPTPVIHLPVGSNIPRVPIDAAEAKQRLGIGPGVGVIGLFGTAHASRLLDRVRNACEAATAAGHDVVLLYIGPHVDAVREAMGPGVRVMAGGAASADEVSRRLSAVDVFLSPFVDGVSTRRGSFLAALGHGLACVGTDGVNTDPVLRTAAGEAFVLADAVDPHGMDRPTVELLAHPTRRTAIGRSAATLFDHEFAWPRLIARIDNALSLDTEKQS